MILDLNGAVTPILEYYQAEGKSDGYVWFSWKACQKQFPELKVEMKTGGSVERPSFSDLHTLVVGVMDIVEILAFFSEGSFESDSFLDDNDSLILDSIYKLAIIDPASLPKKGDVFDTIIDNSGWDKKEDIDIISSLSEDLDILYNDVEKLEQDKYGASPLVAIYWIGD